MKERLSDFINEGKYAKYLTKGKKKRHASAPANKDYKVEFKIFKKKLVELNKAIDLHISKQQDDPMEYGYVGQIQAYNNGLNSVIQMIKMDSKKG